MRSLLLVSSLTIGGCHYTPGSYVAPGNYPVRPWSGTRVALLCVDLAVAEVSAEGIPGPIVQYTFGNRCDHPVAIDLASVRVTTRDTSGNELRLHADDPRQEIRVLPIGALDVGSEWIRYVADGAPPLPSLAQICVDIGGVAAGAPIRERWVCLATEGAS